MTDKNIEDIYDILFNAFSIKRNKSEHLSKKRAQTMLNVAVKKLLDINPHLHYYGTANDFTIESILRFPELLIHENDEKLRSNYLSYLQNSRIIII